MLVNFAKKLALSLKRVTTCSTSKVNFKSIRNRIIECYTPRNFYFFTGVYFALRDLLPCLQARGTRDCNKGSKSSKGRRDYRMTLFTTISRPRDRYYNDHGVRY